MKYAKDMMISVDPPNGVVPALRSALNKFDITGTTIMFDTDAIRKGLNFNEAYKFHLESVGHVVYYFRGNR